MAYSLSKMVMNNVLNINLQDIDEVMSLIKEVVYEMEDNEISQWDDLYPDYGVILNDIHAENMFGIFINLELAGSWFWIKINLLNIPLLNGN